MSIGAVSGVSNPYYKGLNYATFEGLVAGQTEFTKPPEKPHKPVPVFTVDSLDIKTARPEALPEVNGRSFEWQLDYYFGNVSRKNNYINNNIQATEKIQENIVRMEKEVKAGRLSYESKQEADSRLSSIRDSIATWKEVLVSMGPETEQYRTILSGTLQHMKVYLSTPGALAYARDVIYQRSALEKNGEPVDIVALMKENGVMSAEEAAQYPSLTVNATPKNLAYAASVQADKDAKAAEDAARYAAQAAATLDAHPQPPHYEDQDGHDSPYPENSAIFSAEELTRMYPGAKLPHGQYLLKFPDDLHVIFMEDVLKAIRLDGAGNLIPPDGFRLYPWWDAPDGGQPAQSMPESLYVQQAQKYSAGAAAVSEGSLIESLFA